MAGDSFGVLFRVTSFGESHGPALGGVVEGCPPGLAFRSWEAVGSNPFFCADPGAVPILEKFLDELRASGDSCGARLNLVAEGVPPGWGEPVYSRLDADLASAMLSMNAVKGV